MFHKQDGTLCYSRLDECCRNDATMIQSSHPLLTGRSSSVSRAKSFPQTVKCLPVWGSAAEPPTPSEEQAGRSPSPSLRSPWLLLPLLPPWLLLHPPSPMKEWAGPRRRSASPWRRAGWGQCGSRPRSCSSWRRQRARGWWRMAPPGVQQRDG